LDSTQEEEPDEGELVVISLESVSASGDRARGRLLERIGFLGEPGVEERVILRLFEIPDSFAKEALDEAARLPEQIAEASLAGRWDLRDRPAITIDGETARDFDDAVSAFLGKGENIVVEVHIADVSHYVRPGSALDGEARRRGTSVYLPGLCVPMVPERISNDLCSLRAGVDRLTYTVRFNVSAAGEIDGFEIHDSVIRSRRRCTYDEVFEWLEMPRDSWPENTSDFADSLALLALAAERLSRDRRERGSLDFDLAAPEIRFDDQGRVVAVTPELRNRAHRLIEELMVAANQCVARYLIEHHQPALHRVHDRPDANRVEDLRAVLVELGYELKGSAHDLEPASLQRVLDMASGRPEERLFATLVLRTMARALYSPEPRGHYALAVDAYLHFTSPIRRYPDLLCHRMLRRLQKEGKALLPPELEQLHKELEVLGESCSNTEQRAEAAEREAVQWKTVLFLRNRVGEHFDGHISGVTSFGLFVQLDEVLLDGLIHISELQDDYYDHDEPRHRLVGQRTHRAWRLGDAVNVQLVGVDLDAMQVRLAPAPEVPAK
jgi:ribonuclease R